MARVPKNLFVKDARLVSFVPPRVVEGHLRIERGRVVEAGPGIGIRRGDAVVDRWGKVVAPALVLAPERPWDAARVADGSSSDGLRDRAILALLDALAGGSGATLLLPPAGAEGDAFDALAGAFEEVGLRGVVGLRVDGGSADAPAVERMRARLADARLARVRGALVLDAANAAAPRVGERLFAWRSETGAAVHAEIGAEPEAARRGLRALLAAGVLGRGATLSGFVGGAEDEVRAALAAGARIVDDDATPERAGSALLGTGGRGGDLLERLRGARAAAGSGGFDPLGALAAAYAWMRERFDLPFGGIEPGAPADLLFLDDPSPVPPTAASLAAWLGALSSRHVESVLVEGESLYRRREPAWPVDRERLAERVRERAGARQA